MEPRHFLALLLLGACSGSESVDHDRALEPPPAHPFLVVRAEDYPALRARAAQRPWSEQAEAARRYAREQSFDPAEPDFDAKQRMTDLCGALALAYVLDPSPELADKTAATLERWEDFFLATAPSGSGVLVRWRQSAMVQSIFALDVVHAALPPGRREALEALLDRMNGTWWRERDQDGTTSTPGVVALWALYRGDRALAAEATALFRERLFDELTPGGVFDSGPGYAWARQGGDRISKYALIDVLEFTGRDRTLYADPRLVGLQEWLFRGAYTPARTNLTFGDSDPSRPVEALLGYVQPHRVARFSERAGRNAAWLVRDVEPRPLLSSFALIDDAPLEPLAPTSCVWTDCASFWEDARSADSLMAALWCPRSSGSHSHFDVNAVHLYAYGKNVVRNVGYCGAGAGIDASFDWNWVSATARSSNTVTIDGEEHVDKSGRGVLEGLSASGLDYALADSGRALPNGKHTRALWMVHGEPEMPGYFVLLDEIEASASDAIARVALHPDSRAIEPLVPGEEYEWTVEDGAVRATLFLATPPDDVELLDGGLCAFDGNEFVGKYVSSSYSTGPARKRRALSVVFPHDARRGKPEIERLAGSGFSGALLAAPSGVVDTALESAASAPLVLGQESALAHALWFRVSGGRVTRYFAARGRSFDSARDVQVGFESDAELSLVVEGTEVTLVSGGATVVFRDPGIAGTSFSTEVGSVRSSEPGRVEIALNPGRFSFDLNTGTSGD